MRKAAEQGQLIAQFNLGSFFEHGRGVAQSYEEAAKWWLRAAEKGFASAQVNLGNLFQDGYGVVQSDERAIMWWQKAAEQGHAVAKNILDRRNGRLQLSPVQLMYMAQQLGHYQTDQSSLEPYCFGFEIFNQRHHSNVRGKRYGGYMMR